MRTTGWRVCGGLAVAMGVQAAWAAGNEFDCMIEPAQVVEVRSPVAGILQQVHARRGQFIRQGEVLATIESSVEHSVTETARFRSTAQGSLLLARNKVNAAREKARRYQALYEEEFVSGQARDDAEAELRLAQAEQKTAEENMELARLQHKESLDQLNRRVLRSPFNGVVMDQYLYPGSMVDGAESKKPILKIAQTQPLAVQAILPFQLFPQVQAGAPVVVVPEKPFTRELQARSKTVDRVLDSAAGTFNVWIDLDNARHELPGGIRCKLRIHGVQ